MELKVLGQSLLLKVPNGQEQYYKNVANELDNMISEFIRNNNIRSDTKAAISVAYKLLFENKKLKENISHYKDVDNKINDILVKLENN